TDPIYFLAKCMQRAMLVGPDSRHDTHHSQLELKLFLVTYIMIAKNCALDVDILGIFIARINRVSQLSTHFIQILLPSKGRNQPFSNLLPQIADIACEHSSKPTFRNSAVAFLSTKRGTDFNPPDSRHKLDRISKF